MAVARWTAGVVTVIFLAACTPNKPEPVAPQSTPRSSSIAPAIGEGAVQDVAQGVSSYEVPVKSTERITDGTTTVTNTWARPVTLVSVEPVFADRPDSEVILGIHVVRRKANVELVGIARIYPPQYTQLTEVKGAILNPELLSGDWYQFIVGLNVRAGTVALTGLRVTFRADGVAYARTLAHSVKLCVGRPDGATTC